MKLKREWHKTLSFSLGGGAKLYKNFDPKLLAVSLCMAVVLVSIPMGTWSPKMAHAEIIAIGSCGDPNVNDGKNVTWRLEPNGNKVTVEMETQDAYTLTISGNGEMISATCYTPPWNSYDAQITTVVIEEGVELIGYKAFECCYNLSSVYIPSSVYSFGDEAFSECDSLTRIYIPCDETEQSLKQLFSSDCDITDIDDADGTFTFKNSAGRQGTFVQHTLSDTVVSEPTAEKLGEVHSTCSRCTTSVAYHYTLKEGASPAMYPDGTRISDASYTPKAGGPFNLNGQEIEILLQDPLGVLGSGTLGLSVEPINLPVDFDGDVDVEHAHSYEIVPTVGGVKRSGKLSNKVRLLYKIPQGWDRADLEVFLAQAGDDREFDEVTEKIGDDEYLVVWTDHFSPYVFVDKLNPEEKAELEALQAADGSNGDSNTLQGDAGNGQTNGDHYIKTGDASGEILMLSTLAMIATGLYLGLFLKKKKSF